jgi:hypothetical protein
MARGLTDRKKSPPRTISRGSLAAPSKLVHSTLDHAAMVSNTYLRSYPVHYHRHFRGFSFITIDHWVLILFRSIGVRRCSNQRGSLGFQHCGLGRLLKMHMLASEVETMVAFRGVFSSLLSCSCECERFVQFGVPRFVFRVDSAAY